MTATVDECVETAREYLPVEVVEQWVEQWKGLLRRGYRLRPLGPGEEAAVVCRLGGNPRMPEDQPWPQWPGHGPLTFIAALDCAALPPGETDLVLPDAGTLLFFFFDGQLDDGYEVVTAAEESSQPGARLIYVPQGVPVVERTAPVVEGVNQIRPRTEQALTADQVITAPAYDASGGYPDDASFFTDLALDLGGPGPHHLLGGWALPIQDAVELEVARYDHAQAREWLLLAQIDTDERAGMVWGDGGARYWLIRRQDLIDRRFDRARFTSQS